MQTEQIRAVLVQLQLEKLTRDELMMPGLSDGIRMQRQKGAAVSEHKQLISGDLLEGLLQS